MKIIDITPDRAIELVQNALNDIRQNPEARAAMCLVREYITAHVGAQISGTPERFSSQYRHADGGIEELIYRLCFTVEANYPTAKVSVSR